VSQERTTALFFGHGKHGFKLNIADNFDETYDLSDGPPQYEALLPDMRGFVTSEPVGLPPDAATAHDAYQAVLRDAGATRPRRDAVDERIVTAVRTRTGKLMRTHPEKAGGWPELRSAAWPPDLDEDGMADAWERSAGLNPADPNDGAGDPDGDGWTNLEEYLHELAGDSGDLTAIRISGGSGS
jgi:pectate lyase